MFGETSHDLEKSRDPTAIVIDAGSSSDTIQMRTEHDNAIWGAFGRFHEHVIDGLLFPLRRC